MIDRLKTGSKRAARHVADRVLAPYVERLSSEIRGARDPGSAGGASPAPEGGRDFVVPADFFHIVLHELRTIELERVPKGARRVVSVGASGRWYFDWFEASVGPVDVHVGVEAFEPEPADLPAYVRWLATTADRFDGVEDADVDLVFAGQTTEHLWADELAEFLLQSRRVLRSDGLLVLDSPNRLVTEHLHWSHGGHTVELSAEEITELLTLAGFRVDVLRGLWRCQFGDRVLQLEERVAEPAMLVRRIADGPERPDDCFVWWLVARPDGSPDRDGLRNRTDELYRQHWPTRVCRGMWPGPGSEGVDLEAGATRVVTSLPFMLRPGRWRIGLRLAAGQLDSIGDAEIEISLPGDHVVHHLRYTDAKVDSAGIWWELDQSELMFALSLSLRIGPVAAPVCVAMPLSITPTDGVS